MAIRRIIETKVGARCAVRVYRNPEFGEYIVKSAVGGKVQGGKSGGYFTDSRTDAMQTAAFEVKRLAKLARCR